MVSHRLRMTAAGSLVALALALAGCGTGDDGAGGGRIASWCQVDDPAMVEAERVKRKLAIDSIGDIECPEPASPEDLPDELILPMPCGRHMVFRAVRVGVADALGGETAIFGDPESPDAFRRAISGPWFGEVSGGFPAQANGSGMTAYYIAKYETTAPQYAVFSGAEEDFGDDSAACKRSAEALKGVRGTAVLPATNLSWSEATAFADRYSRWLIAREKSGGGLGSIMPARESRPGFLRLPTEAEWEFAARGADETGSGGQTYTIAPGWGPDGPAELERIAWFAGIGQEPPEGSSTYPVGRKAPNRLMLFDMIGNAEEMTFDLFRPVRPDGSLAGRPGGIVVRGGSASDGADVVGAGSRRELEAYDAGGPARSPTLGFRLVISAPYYVNKQGLTGEMQGNPDLRDGVSQAWKQREAAGGADGKAAGGNALDLIRALRSGQAAGGAASADSAQLGELQRQIELASAKAAEAEADSTEELLLGALMAAGYARERHGKISQLERDIAQFGGMELNAQEQADLAAIKALLPANRTERTATLAYYGTAVIELARRPAGQLSGAQTVVSGRLQRAGLSRLATLFPLLVRHVEQARSGPPASSVRQSWYFDVLSRKSN